MKESSSSQSTPRSKTTRYHERDDFPELLYAVPVPYFFSSSRVIHEMSSSSSASNINLFNRESFCTLRRRFCSSCINVEQLSSGKLCAIVQRQPYGCLRFAPEAGTTSCSTARQSPKFTTEILRRVLIDHTRTSSFVHKRRKNLKKWLGFRKRYSGNFPFFFKLLF